MIDPIFDGVIGHETILKILTRTSGHPAPAYLFVGPDGVGKRLVAERFTRLLLKHPLETSLDAHPDFIRVKRLEDAKEITVKQARELMQRMHLSAAAGGRKIALVEQADRLSEEAANALLKAVEEPSPSATYLFIAEQQSRLPATLRSRLTAIPFGRVPGTSVESEHRAEAKALLKTLQNDPLGMQCAALEKLAHQLEAQDDPESAWRSFLMLLMEEWSGHHEAQPNEALRLGIGLTHAWQLAGTSLSPRLALEWSAVRPYLISERSLPSFLNPSYL